ncbi:hypothetical protein F383_28370 [Gossypium arboreum]|uniref:Uncharacterized protein n=1 Tax=Gossypium arboreum TaxID=29729 RepID=A0A0B0PBV8_GOSAR|nr:hypothetical protein F383_28370 [Gossypium arboreum]
MTCLRKRKSKLVRTQGSSGASLHYRTFVGTFKDGKLALQIAYFYPHGQRHGRVSQPCATHGHVTRPCVPWGSPTI